MKVEWPGPRVSEGGGGGLVEGDTGRGAGEETRDGRGTEGLVKGVGARVLI